METERKFIVKYLPKDLQNVKREKMRQAYISVSPVIRIRNTQDSYILTIKGRGHIQREEKELFISRQEYLNLLKKAETESVEKTRYYYPLEDGYIAQIDIYEGGLKGLVTAEVEFQSLEEAEGFRCPDFFGEDVSLCPEYKNVNLALKGRVPHKC